MLRMVPLPIACGDREDERLELAPDLEAEDRADQPVAMLDEGDRTGPAALVDGPVPHAGRGEDVGDRASDGEAEDVLVLDVEAGPDRAFPLAADFGQAVVQRVQGVVGASAPRPVAVRDVVAKADFES